MQSLLRLASLPVSALLLSTSACTDDAASPMPSEPSDPADPSEPSSPLPSYGAQELRPVERPAPGVCIPDGPTAAVYGTAGIDELRDVTVTGNGTILVVGFENGQASMMSTTPTGSRGVVLSYRNGFSPIALLDTLGTDSFESIAIDPHSQRTFLAGRTNDTLAGFPSKGNHDYVLGELGAHGFTPMARGFDSTPEYPRQLAVGGGRLAIVGRESRLTADGSTRINPFLSNYTVGTELAQQWFTTRWTAAAETNTAVAMGASSFAVASAISDGEELGMFVTMWSHDADVLWRRYVSTQAFDEIAALHVLPDGNVLWAGTSRATLGETSFGGDDVVVGVLDGETGESVWTQQIGTAGDERVADMAIDASGNIVIAGDVTTESERDVFMMKLDSEGAVLAHEEWGSSQIDTASAVAIDACGTAAIVGTTSGDLGGPSKGMRDGFLLIAR